MNKTGPIHASAGVMTPGRTVSGPAARAPVSVAPPAMSFSCFHSRLMRDGGHQAICARQPLLNVRLRWFGSQREAYVVQSPKGELSSPPDF